MLRFILAAPLALAFTIAAMAVVGLFLLMFVGSVIVGFVALVAICAWTIIQSVKGWLFS